MGASEQRGPEIGLVRVSGLAAQLIGEICQHVDGCSHVESRTGGYALVFAAGTDHIDAWQRVHHALLEVDPIGERLTMAEGDPPPAPHTELVGAPTHVSVDELPPPAPAG